MCIDLMNCKYIDFKFSSLKFGEVNEFNVVLARIQKSGHQPVLNHNK